MWISSKAQTEREVPHPCAIHNFEEMRTIGSKDDLSNSSLIPTLLGLLETKCSRNEQTLFVTGWGLILGLEWKLMAIAEGFGFYGRTR